jgi:general secretion pathway protein J
MSAARPNPPRERGFTLVEMLVSLLIFGIIASIATAMATGATRSFAASQGALGTVTALDDMRTILAADLGQAARRPSLGADGKPMPAFTLTPDGFVLTRYRAEGVLPAVEKVAWGHADGLLLRQPFPAIDGAPPGDATPMIKGIAGARFRVMTDSGWSDSWAPSDPADLPRAVELTLVRQDGVPITLKLLVGA